MATVLLPARGSRRTEAPRPEAAYHLHTSSGLVPVDAYSIKELKAELGRRLEGGEFEAEAQKRRWMPVSGHDGTLAGRIDLLAERDEERFAGLESGHGPLDFGKDIYPYVWHTRTGSVTTAAWTAHEFQMELERLLDEGRLQQEACLRCWTRVTQGWNLVGHVDPSAKQFILRAKAQNVAYWLRHASGSLPLLATTTEELCGESRDLCQTGEFLEESARDGLLEVWTAPSQGGQLVGRIAANGGEFSAAPPDAQNYEVHRPGRRIGGRDGARRPLSKLSLDGTLGLEGLRSELGRLLFEGEFHVEEDDGVRWLPVTQGGQLVGHLDPAAREFCAVEEQYAASYAVRVDGCDHLPMAAETIEELRSELAERFDDLRRLTQQGGDWVVTCAGNPIGVFDYSVGLLLDRTFDIRRVGGKEAPEGVACAACRYWRFEKELVAFRDAEGLDVRVARSGACKRSFPHPYRGWPTTVENDWCGEFEAAEP